MNPDDEFNKLHKAVTDDLCALGDYEPASDNDDEEYDELYCPPDPEMPAVYILRPSPDKHTLVVSAHDYDLREIEINSLADWEPYRVCLSGGVPFEAVPEKEQPRHRHLVILLMALESHGVEVSS